MANEIIKVEHDRFHSLLVATYNAINLFAQSRIPVGEWPHLLP